MVPGAGGNAREPWVRGVPRAPKAVRQNPRSRGASEWPDSGHRRVGRGLPFPERTVCCGRTGSISASSVGVKACSHARPDSSVGGKFAFVVAHDGRVIAKCQGQPLRFQRAAVTIQRAADAHSRVTSSGDSTSGPSVCSGFLVCPTLRAATRGGRNTSRRSKGDRQGGRSLRRGRASAANTP